jgi:hypothetical protein
MSLISIFKIIYTRTNRYLKIPAISACLLMGKHRRDACGKPADPTPGSL